MTASVLKNLKELAKSSLEPQWVGKTDAEAPRTGMIGVNAAEPEVAAP